MRRIMLCIDDEALILLSLAEELQGYFGQDFAYETATSGEEALEIIDTAALEGDRIAVIVSDLLMPGMRGDELLAKLAERRLSIPTILLTGHADPEVLEGMKVKSGVTAYLRKPWVGEDLERLVRGCLEVADREQGGR